MKFKQQLMALVSVITILSMVLTMAIPAADLVAQAQDATQEPTAPPTDVPTNTAAPATATNAPTDQPTAAPTEAPTTIGSNRLYIKSLWNNRSTGNTDERKAVSKKPKTRPAKELRVQPMTKPLLIDRSSMLPIV